MKHEHYLTYYLITWGFMCVGSLLPSYHDTFYIALFSAVVSTANALLQVRRASVKTRGEASLLLHALLVLYSDNTTD